MAIVPDTKNWAWVLDRPCGECGFDGPGLEAGAVAGVMRRVGDAWQPILVAPGAGERPSPDRWSPLEYGCHVRDVLRLASARVSLMVVQCDPVFPDWDQDQTAEETGYADQDGPAVAATLLSWANRFADDLDGLSGPEWDRTGQRSDGTRFSAATFARYVLHDPLHHLHDVGAPLG